MDDSGRRSYKHSSGLSLRGPNDSTDAKDGSIDSFDDFTV